jgi:AraC-like DNA-binding protein
MGRADRSAAAGLRYRELPPAPGLAPLVAFFWELVVPADGLHPVIHHVLPDGLAALVYLRRPPPSLSWLRVLGPRMETFPAPLHPGDVYWGLRLQPAAVAAVLGGAGALYGGNLDCAQVNAALFARLKGPLDDTATFPAAVALFSAALRGTSGVDQLVARAARAIVAENGEVRIGEVARGVGLGVRQLQRRFRRATALTPKQFARARRVRATVLAIVRSGARTRWSALAAEAGFADQAHLAHELARVTGRTPSAVEKTLRAIEHGPLVS